MVYSSRILYPPSFIRLWVRNLLFIITKISGIFYKSPANLSYWWNFGFLALFFLISQIVTGIFLAMFYSANVEIVFGIIFDLTSEIYYGWWLRNIHANGASFFFLAVYLHMARGIYYGSFIYPRQLLWVSGTIIWVLMIATAFLGYILPWGQMSFWGAMVITSLLGAIPSLGNDILFLLWGSYSIDNATLMRFYSLHFTLPFIIMALSILHIALLHEYGSSNPLGILVKHDNIPFVPYYGLKDLFSIILVLIVFLIFVTYVPDMLGHSDNFNIANSLVTPAHIVPEWYFLPLYAILRSVTNKLLGIVLIGASILCILLLPFICKNFIIRNSTFRPFYCCAVWFFFIICLLLGWIGSLPVIFPYLLIGQHLTGFFFFWILILFPFIGFIENLFYIIYVKFNPTAKYLAYIFVIPYEILEKNKQALPVLWANFTAFERMPSGKAKYEAVTAFHKRYPCCYPILPQPSPPAKFRRLKVCYPRVDV